MGRRGSFVVYPSAARTATPTAVLQNSRNAPGIHVIIDVTAITATPSVVPTIRGYDATSGQYYTILTGTAIVATGTTVLKVHPSITALANGSARDGIPDEWDILMTHADTDSITYSVVAKGIG